MSNVVDLPKLYTEPEAAKRLRTSMSTMYRLRRSKKIGFTMVGGSIRYLEKHITEYLDSQSCQPSESPKNIPSSGDQTPASGTSFGSRKGRGTGALQALNNLQTHG
jgi:excisionase family DNA binding protein